MRRQILSRAFYGWLSHCRHLKTVRTHLSGLVNNVIVAVDDPSDASGGLSAELWAEMSQGGVVKDKGNIYRLVYYGGCVHEVRKEVWPYLLGHYAFGSTEEERVEHDDHVKQQYERTMSEWLAIEAIVRQRDKETMAANLAKLSQESQDMIPLVRKDSSLSNDVFESIDSDDFSHPETHGTPTKSSATPHSPDEGLGDSIARTSSIADSKRSDSCDTDKCMEIMKSGSESSEQQEHKNILITNATVDVPDRNAAEEADVEGKLLSTSEDGGGWQEVLSMAELLDSVALNLHRIDKDVQRCDRNYWYFTPTNLDKLRNVMCTYVWEHLEVGYVQGMCDLVAPLLVIFDDEAKAYSCFCHLMKRMSSNFPHGGAMDQHFANMRSLIQLFEHMHQYGDYTHFYFCYRWFLLDFKRELVYDDVFCVWETIWAARHISSRHFVLFLALALVQYYRDIIMDNNMDFTDIIKFFNEMAERHNAKQVLQLSRELVYKLQDLIDNK
ncbi:hypothetical protein CAPTEDRAFT_191445 [Capitella teleta]|uniref:Rab-GAP TBC domain-containing protein n=1 Tax=Capitella teleta TaxID=283909 RepID=R7VHV1_CAPTE|nr:hypothetical protein CAPTEDRAFT_191445 [Capitella teleta]|eukprot:ELU15270.1 hypothetical protein CAPTEDRAFT_191445 [Capitella teleta]